MKEKLNKLNIEYLENVSLKNYNTMRLDSLCYLLVFPKNIEELINVINITKGKYFILGNGSNVILPSKCNVVIKLKYFNKMSFNNSIIDVESGYMLNKLALDISNMGYTSLEWATGIPGTIGGALYSNAGAYNSSISDLLIEATIFDGKEVKVYSKEELNFGYRTSIFRKDSNLIVLSCKLKVLKGNIETIKSLISDRTNRRISTQDLSHPSCGSVFRNPDGFSAGKLIDDLGLKGIMIGGAKVSDIHANFIINENNATSEDVINLINLVRKKVKENYNIDLVSEVQIVNEKI